MVFPRKSGNKLKEPSLPSLSLACQFPLHPVSPGREKAEISHRTLKRHLGFGKRNTVNKANVVRVSLNIYIYILGPRDIPTLGSMTVVTVECNCIKGMQIYGADFRPNTCRVHIYMCVCEANKTETSNTRWILGLRLVWWIWLTRIRFLLAKNADWITYIY